MKKYLSYILILIALVGLFGSAHWTYAQPVTQHCYNLDGTERTESTYEACLAAGGFWRAPTAGGGTPCTNSPTNTIPTGCTPPAAASKIYNLLAPLPDGNNGTMSTFDPTGAGGGALGAYLNLMIKLFIGICAVLAVIMIVMGGIQYMTSELPGNKEAGKERIMHAIFGLLLALGAWTLLNTINPDLLKTDLTSLADVTVDVTLSTLADGKTYGSTGGAGAGGGGGNCTVQTNPNNACSPTNPANSCFGSNANQASQICNLESGGGQTGVKSGSDLLNSGTGPSYSVGLWQINLTVHQVGGLNCPAAFSGTCGKGTATPSKSGPFVGGPKVGNCSVTIINQALYDQCVAAAQDPKNSTAVACQEYNNNGFKPWAYSANKCGVST